ncbi:thiol reductant ABC exporter subunit CydD [Brevundimonas terrae]|uniref:Thiol reductant ABC exporter subunit CydD n=1 Tax=Brevundimonas terrae TaxID=363631 RepID=A0ABP3IEQ2_9CAUL|nr:thiol reductant ABC exporter subunit CydD [Brevundimonas terrae]NIJ28025.1 ATP-binding cassette subfamily C protein CydD [Brevundimonas terrae]
MTATDIQSPDPASKEASRAAANWLSAATAPWKKRATLSAALVIADVVPAIGFAAGLGLALGAIVPALADPGAASVLKAVTPGAALAVGSLLLRGVLGQAATLSASHLSQSIKSALRGRLMSGVFSGKLSDSEAMAAAVEGVDALDGFITRFRPIKTAAVVSPLVLIAAAAVVSPFTAGILVFTLLPFVIGMALTGMAAAAESRRQFVAMERLSGLFLDRIRALPAILAFQSETQQSRQIARASDELARRTSKVLKVAFLSSAILEFFSALAVALVAVYCGFNLLRLLPFPAPDVLTLGQAFFLLALAPEVYQPMRRLAAAYHDRQAADSAVPHLQALEQAAPAAVTRSINLHHAPALTFDKVTITYGDAAPVISDFSLTVPTGRTIALIGASGTGKSSLIHLLLGLSPLSGGQILIDGEPLASGEDLSASIAYAGQAPMVIPGTLEDNIRIALPQASTRQIMEAAAKAGLRGDLARNIDERGGGLSGGERRRLGLARAFLKPAPILLLDEPTAHLDAASEQALLAIIKQASEGRTTLIATHSDAVAALADTVVELS